MIQADGQPLSEHLNFLIATTPEIQANGQLLSEHLNI
jgi:hypothetical protein